MPITGKAQGFNRQQPKPYAKNRETHVANTKIGMGDNYGQAIKQKVGRMRSDPIGSIPMSGKKLGTPPRSLA